MNYPPGVAYVDGDYVPVGQAKISVLDWGFLRSDATYDVVHVWKKRFFRLDWHLDRFTRSVAKIKLSLPVSRDELMHILAECVRRSRHEDAYVEMILTRGVSPTFSRDPRDAVNRLICFAIPFGWILKPDDRERGLDAIISDRHRIDPASVDSTVKNYHWLDLVMGMYEAYDQGATTVILTDRNGNVTEGPGFNVFVVRGGRIATPNRGVLEGITRRSAITIARELRMPVEERAVSADEVRAADEVFATSTAGGVMPITGLDGSPVGDGKMGPVTGRLIETYWAKHDDPEWSTSVEDIS